MASRAENYDKFIIENEKNVLDDPDSSRDAKRKANSNLNLYRKISNLSKKEK